MVSRSNSSASFNIAGKREAMSIIMNFANMHRKSISGQSSNSNDSNLANSTARIKKNFSFSSSKNAVEANTISVHHSLQRESKRQIDDINSEGLIDYPTVMSGQSSNKLKSKKSLPIGSAIKGTGSKQNSILKSEKGTYFQFYNNLDNSKKGKGKRSIANHKSSSFKGPSNQKSAINKISFEDYFKKQNQDISLPYIQSSNSANQQPASLINTKDAKWSPSKIIGDHNIMSNLNKNQKSKLNYQ